jgi:hypothetical protein
VKSGMAQFKMLNIRKIGNREKSLFSRIENSEKRRIEQRNNKF